MVVNKTTSVAHWTVGLQYRADPLNRHLGGALRRRKRSIDDGDRSALITDALKQKGVPFAAVARPGLGACEPLEDLIDPDITLLTVLVKPLHDGHVLADGRIIPGKLPCLGKVFFVEL